MLKESKQKINRISIDDAKKRMKEVVFVDARGSAAMSRNPLQLPNAIHLAPKELGNGLSRVSRKQTIVTYCT